MERRHGQQGAHRNHNARQQRFVVLLCCALMLGAGLLGFSANAMARKVFLNGVNITGLTNQTFKKVSIRIDANGDIRITGKQYKVKVKGSGTPAAQSPAPAPTPSSARNTPVVAPKAGVVPPSQRPSQKYVMVMQRSGNEASGYSLRLLINGKLVRTVNVGAEQDVLDITPYLKKGTNQVMVEAFKQKMTGGTLTLLIGQGGIKKGRVLIQQPYALQYARKGVEKTNFRHIYTINTP